MNCFECHRRMQALGKDGLVFVCRNNFCRIYCVTLAASYDPSPDKRAKKKISEKKP